LPQEVKEMGKKESEKMEVGKYHPEPNPEFVGLLEAHGFVKDKKRSIWFLNYPSRGIHLEANFTGTANGHYCGERIDGEKESSRMSPGDVKHWFGITLGWPLPPKIEDNCI